ncbi:MAG: hypothetical protein FWE78_02345 [Methanimicrococcus sp.]|nr:hypothetical protein [Methanimicrococcus sp.]
MIYFIFMTIVIATVSVVLFTYIPRDEALKAIQYSAWDMSASPESDIVLVYSLRSPGGTPPTFGADAGEDVYKMTYVWTFNGHAQSYRAEIPTELLEYYRAKPHDYTEYQRYALSDYDREVIRSFADAFKENGRRNKYTDDQIAMNIITFVYTLPYTSDLETTGFVEYPRYPIETLVEGGDCEDRAILISALLYELGIENIIIQLEDHAAVGLKDNGKYTGKYYNYNGTRYYYAEVSETSTSVGVIPPNINQTLVALYPVTPTPYFSSKINQYSAGRNADGLLYSLSGTIKNQGPGEGKNVTIRVVTTMSGLNGTAPPDKLILIGDLPEDYIADIESRISVPNGNSLVEIYLEGDNFDPIPISGFYVTGR